MNIYKTICKCSCNFEAGASESQEIVKTLGESIQLYSLQNQVFTSPHFMIIMVSLINLNQLQVFTHQ